MAVAPGPKEAPLSIFVLFRQQGATQTQQTRPRAKGALSFLPLAFDEQKHHERPCVEGA